MSRDLILGVVGKRGEVDLKLVSNRVLKEEMPFRDLSVKEER
jgi:hypothetical protein